MQSRTLLIVCALQPLDVEEPFREHLLPSLDDQGFPAIDDVKEHQLLELLLAEVPDLVCRDAKDPFEVLTPIHQTVEIQVWRDRVELGLGMQRGRHLAAMITWT